MAKGKGPVGLHVAVERADATTLACELLAVDAYEGVESFGGVRGASRGQAEYQFGGVTRAVDEATGGALSRVVAAGDFKGKWREAALVHPTTGPTKRVLLVGMGKLADLSPERVRRVGAIVARRARDVGAREAHAILAGVRRKKGGLHPRAVGEALAEGALLGSYVFEQYKGPKTEEQQKEEKPKLARVVLVEKNGSIAREAEKGVAAGTAIAESVNLCRDWACYSGDDAAAEMYGERAAKLARQWGLKVEVLDKARIRELGMGGLLAVNRGSAREPRLVTLTHAPKKARGTVVLVGKGVTFDSGGISIKPADKMEEMKYDKCGASAVAGAVVAAKRLGLPLKVVAVMPFTDNLLSGDSYKPGDVVRTMSGKTIEVINTDAEGRVILADALHYGGRFEPDAMVELSTLTGACPIAVGHHCIAGMGNSDDLLKQLRKAGDAVNERVWPLPFLDEYGEMVKSKVADVKNSAGRTAGTVTAGKFLEHFVGDHPWVHLDIAGVAWHDGTMPRLNEEYCPEQPTGAGVRLLVEWMRHYETPTLTKKRGSDLAKAEATRGAAKPTRGRVAVS
jgi:leucyl aminopeptidase